MTEARNYSSDATLKNGLEITVRAVRPDDRARLQKAFAGLERESVYTRFFGYKNELSPADLDRIARTDFVDNVMLVATLRGSDDETIIAAASYVSLGGSEPRSAEIAFTVEEDYHGLGLAGRLLEHLAKLARGAGILRFEADVLSENKGMLAVFRRSGLPMQTRRDSGTVHVTLALDDVR